MYTYHEYVIRKFALPFRGFFLHVFVFWGNERLSYNSFTGTCHQYWAMWLGHVAKEEGLIQVGKSRIENNQANRTDGYTINVYNQPDIQINIFWWCIYIYINHVMDIFVTFLSPNVKGRITQRGHVNSELPGGDYAGATFETTPLSYATGYRTMYGSCAGGVDTWKVGFLLSYFVWKTWRQRSWKVFYWNPFFCFFLCCLFFLLF